MSEVPFESLWEAVAEDRSRGSRELLHFTLEQLRERLRDGVDLTEDDLMLILRRLSTVRSEMALFRSVAALLHDEITAGELSPPEAFREALHAVNDRLERYRYRLAEEFSATLDGCQSLVLFSRSGTVLDLLQSRPHDLDRMYVLESRPGGEGIDVANCLSEDYSVEFRYDVEAPGVIESADVICVGADSLRPGGAVVNKVGTRLLGATDPDVGLTVCTETLKYSPEPYRSDQAPTTPSPEELNPSLRRPHPLFEEVPPELIARYVTEKGLYTDPAELLDECSDLKQAHRRLSESAADVSRSG